MTYAIAVAVVLTVAFLVQAVRVPQSWDGGGYEASFAVLLLAVSSVAAWCAVLIFWLA